MTLKRVIGDPHSELRRLLAANLPRLGDVLRGELNAQMEGVTTPDVAAPAGAPNGLLGHAIEQRILLKRASRFDFALNGPGDAAVQRFTYRYAVAVPVMRNRQLFEELSARLNEPAVGGYSGTEPVLGDDEDRAARLAITLGMLDQAYRSPVPPDVLMAMATGCETLNEALRLIDASWVADVNACAALSTPALPGDEDSEVRLSPPLRGAVLVGGSDADVLIDHDLVDVKAVTSWRLPLATLLRTFCYALLDTRDEYRVERVGVLLARHGRLVSWDVADVLHRAGGLTPKQARQRITLQLCSS